MRRMESAITKTNTRTRTIAFVGLSIALIALSAWIVIPLGPIPFTLQMFSIPLIICVLRPTEAVASIYGYVVLGAIGVPIFSGMRGGIGVLMGPTGGFLVGYLIGVPLAVLFLMFVRRHRTEANAHARTNMHTHASLSAHAQTSRSQATQTLHPLQTVQMPMPGVAPSPSTKTEGARAFFACYGANIVAGLIFTLVAYAVGWVQFIFVSGSDPALAFAVSVAPFIIPDIIKVVIAAMCAVVVDRALGRA